MNLVAKYIATAVFLAFLVLSHVLHVSSAMKYFVVTDIIFSYTKYLVDKLLLYALVTVSCFILD